MGYATPLQIWKGCTSTEKKAYNREKSLPLAPSLQIHVHMHTQKRETSNSLSLSLSTSHPYFLHKN